MNYRKQGLRALGLSILAALGLMAFTATAAQASGTFLVAGLSGSWTAEATGKGENILESYLQVLKLNLKLACHQISVTNAKISNAGHGTGTISFSSCLVTDNAGNEVDCTLHEPINANVLALVVLHNSKPYILFSPTGANFAVVKSLGEFCTLPKEAAVTGSVVVSISNPDGDDVTKLISTKNMLSLFTADKLFYGAHEGHLVADAEVALSGIHEGLKWGAA